MALEFLFNQLNIKVIMSQEPAAEIAPILEGGVRAAARLITRLEDGDPAARPLVRALYRAGGRALVVGITGPPGAGKSTLADRLIGHYRARDLRVGVVAVDPTSPFTGGALLGDRIRMGRHYTDPGVFIRSMATRGHLGGLARATGDAVTVMDAMGWEVVLIETVGVGQGEVDVVRLAGTVVIVQAPGGGDDVQAAKAGIMEIGDVFAVNKARREGADRTVREIEEALDFRYHPGDGLWRPPVIKTEALEGEGVDALAEGIEARRRYLGENPEAARRLRREQARATLAAVLREAAADRLAADAAAGRRMEALLDALAERRVDPYGLAEELLGGL